MSGFPSPKKGNKRAETAKRPHAGIPLDQNVIAELIVKHAGNISRVADAMGSARGCISRVVEKSQDLTDLLKQCRERQIDELEQSCWVDAIENRDTALRCFLLKTQAKHRGYDQSEAKDMAKDIATAAFDFIINKTKSQPLTHNSNSP